MKNITRELSEEHQNILKVIDMVLAECDKLEKGKEPDSVFFRDIILFIKKYADGFHHAKEEDILFKAMLNNLNNMHCNPIPVMLNEHDAGRQYVKNMTNALNRNKTSDLIENARGYCFLLKNHIYKEDNVLYPMAENSLTDIDKEKVEKQYKTVKADDFFETDIKTFIEKLLYSKAL